MSVEEEGAEILCENKGSYLKRETFKCQEDLGLSPREI